MADIDALIARGQALLEAREGPFKDVSAEPWDWRVREPEWMLDKLVPARSIGMVYGNSNSGKSHLLCDLIATMIAGEAQWQGIPIQTGDVVMFSESIGHIRARMKAYLGDRTPKHRLYLLPTMALELHHLPFLAKWMQELPEPPMLLSMDTLATMFSFDENDNREASILIRQLETLVLPTLDPLGCALLLHHTSKVSEGKSARGASALIGNIDFSWHVSWDAKAELTLARWDKDRWRLFKGCTRWAGQMRRVPVEFENGDCEMSILDWREYTEQAEEVARDLERDLRMRERKAELEQLIARAGKRPFVANSRCRPPAGYDLVRFPLEWSRDVPIFREWLRKEWNVEPVYSRSGTELGVAILGRKRG